MSGVSVAKKNGGQTSAIFANDTRWRPNSQILHRRDRSNSRVTETARPSGVPPSAARPSGVLIIWIGNAYVAVAEKNWNICIYSLLIYTGIHNINLIGTLKQCVVYRIRQTYSLRTKQHSQAIANWRKILLMKSQIGLATTDMEIIQKRINPLITDILIYA